MLTLVNLYAWIRFVVCLLRTLYKFDIKILQVTEEDKLKVAECKKTNLR
jgi:hypothetical protein